MTAIRSLFGRILTPLGWRRGHVHFDQQLRTLETLRRDRDQREALKDQDQRWRQACASCAFRGLKSSSSAPVSLSASTAGNGTVRHFRYRSMVRKASDYK